MVVRKFKGQPSAPGYFKGVIRKVNQVEGCTLARNEVPVCRFTDATWNDLLCEAPAVVIEMGGKVSHGPMVARRAGVPCVSEVTKGEEFWEFVQDGWGIAVNGHSGVVEVEYDEKDLPPPKEKVPSPTEPPFYVFHK
eukprot:TRINITY_DN1348_c0_g1_i1.p1 TRINITY_DN1348_c0_g1~~TRINITY_DN1348_c0_g1_i1.p1  ORF type:complete len:160 (-),score=22.41 TRINITY_DN1348_c0_g1_i1:14-424(-)